MRSDCELEMCKDPVSFKVVLDIYLEDYSDNDDEINNARKNYTTDCAMRSKSRNGTVTISLLKRQLVNPMN